MIQYDSIYIYITQYDTRNRNPAGAKGFVQRIHRERSKLEKWCSHILYHVIICCPLVSPFNLYNLSQFLKTIIHIYIYIVSCNVTCFDCNVLLCRAAGRWVKRWFREMFQSRCLSGRVSPLPSCPKAALFPYAPCCAILFRTFGSPTHRSSFSPGQLGRISWS